MEPVDLFYSYAHEDESLRDELAGHLKIMERRGVIWSWHDRSLTAGQTWDGEINSQLKTADLVLLLDLALSANVAGRHWRENRCHPGSEN